MKKTIYPTRLWLTYGVFSKYTFALSKCFLHICQIFITQLESRHSLIDKKRRPTGKQ